MYNLGIIKTQGGTQWAEIQAVAEEELVVVGVARLAQRTRQRLV
jgi:hypothetical protein